MKKDTSLPQVIVLLTRLRPQRPASLVSLDARELVKASRSLSRAAVRVCNEPMTEAQATRLRNRMNFLLDHAGQIGRAHV